MSSLGLRKLTLIALMSPLALAACDGYEPVLTNDYFPYGNSRTAGSGVAYVLAKMLPAKELKVEAPAEKLEPVEKVKRIVKEIEPAPAPVPETPMEKVFNDAQLK